MGRNARSAARVLASLETKRNAMLIAMADELLKRSPRLLEANEKDISGVAEHGLSAAAVDRLRLTQARITDMAEGIRQVANLEDPVGQVISEWTRPNGLRIAKVRMPIGVVGIIYESRPNVTERCRSAVYQNRERCDSARRIESLNSNLAIAEALQAGGSAQGLPASAVQLIPTKEREAVALMAAMNQYIDLIIPRGGPSLIETVVKHARMPVIKHYHG